MPRNKALVPQARPMLNQMKHEVSAEFGIDLGGETESRFNGAVGGEMTKRLTGFSQQGMLDNLPQLAAIRRVANVLQ